MGKSKVPLLESLAILNNVVKNINKHPSNAADSGSKIRTVKHMMERTLNQLHLKAELSSHQIAAKLLSLPNYGGSILESYLNPIAEMSAAAIWKEKEIAKAHHLWLLPEQSAAKIQSRTVETGMDLDSQNEQDAQQNSQAEESMEADSFIASESENEQEATMEDDSDSGDNEKAPPRTCQRNGKVLLTPDEQHTLESLQSDLGKFKLFTVEHDPINQTPVKAFVALSSIYNNRGPKLKHLSRYEMQALTEIKEKPKGEKVRPHAFPMADGFILTANHEFVLRRKQRTPILTQRFPRHPGQKPTDPALVGNWQKEANLFAHFVLTVFRPEVDFHSANSQENPHEYSFEELQNWITSPQEDDNVISKFRLVLLQRHVKGLSTAHVVKKMSNEFRG